MERGEQMRLTPREREVFDLVAVGLNQREIAQELGIKRSTVSVHVVNIAEKLPGHRTRRPMRAIIRYVLSANATA